MDTDRIAQASAEQPTRSAAAEAYERDVLPFVKPFATAVAQAVSQAMKQFPSPTILDHGAGTGLVTALLHHDHQHAHIHALDPSAAFLSNIEPAPWLTIQQGTAADLPTEPRFNAVTSNLALAFCPEPHTDLRRLHQACHSGAVLSLSALGRAEDVQPFHFFWSAYHEECGAWEPARYVHHRFGDPETLIAAAVDAGWTNAQVSAVTGYRQIDGREAWEWLANALPVGLGDAYVTSIDPQVREGAQRRFLKRWAGARFCRTTSWLLTASA